MGGGAWKVAYADFVTAMMAFFLLMWILNMTSAETKTMLAGIFKGDIQFSTDVLPHLAFPITRLLITLAQHSQKNQKLTKAQKLKFK